MADHVFVSHSTHDDPDGASQPAAPVAELVLELLDPGIDTSGGQHRATATATLMFQPPQGSGVPEVRSPPFSFTAPLGPIEAGEITWYLERYPQWPSGVFQERALGVERKLEEWGRLLAEPLLSTTACEAFEPWKRAPPAAARRFSVLVDADPLAGSSEGKAKATREGATLLLGLPWELAHDGESYLFQGVQPAQVRRRLRNREAVAPLVTEAPVRVLVVNPRPEDEHAGYIDHRVSARPLVEALEGLGEKASEVTLLTPPTKPALETELLRARDAGRPYHVVHFNGHGAYDRERGIGALCFEHPEDSDLLARRRTTMVLADELAAVMRAHRVPLVFLEACETARAEDDPTASVAGQLLTGGVASVVAMSHSVLVETARRFVEAFYRELMAGRRIGDGMLAGQRALKGNSWRGKSFVGDLHLQDWFVPVLFQEELDPQLIGRVPSEQMQRLGAEQRRRALGAVPEEPAHRFVGRSRALLAVERLLALERYAVILGEGGEGKTTLAAELVRWLVKTRRFRRAAFVSMEHCLDARSALFALGDQLVEGFVSQAVQDETMPWQLVERALNAEPTIVLFDNMESVLPAAEGSPGAEVFEPEVLEAIFELCRRLECTGDTRVVFTSREALPEPFASNVVEISRLGRREAIELVGKVLGEGAWMPHTGDQGESDEEVESLVDAVGCHARSLVLLAREVAASGVRHATERLGELMAALAARHPDDRERSLFANVELSLRRLPEEMRRRLPRLAVFQGGGHLGAISQVLGLNTDQNEHVAITQQLCDVGLARMLDYDHLRLDPALGPALDRELSAEERGEARQVWVEAMVQLTRFLDQQQFEDAQQAATLTLLELPNLLGALERLAETADAERVVDVATQLEGLLQFLGRPRALARAAAIRTAASQRLGEWSHGRFQAESAAIDRLIDAGRFAEAVEAAGRLVQRGLAAGEAAFPEAAYDLADAHFLLGRALKQGGAAGAALAPLTEARNRFQKLAEGGSADAARMAAVSLTEGGDCLIFLGRLEEAAHTYEATIELAQAQNDLRHVAVSKGQLGTARMLQQRYPEALTAHTEARKIFEQLGEPGSVAVAWHQMGVVNQDAGQHEEAEHAYQQALKINVQHGDRSRQASTLSQLGHLYEAMDRLEEAVRLVRQAAEIAFELGDLAGEGTYRSNFAICLIKLQRYDEARQEIERAIECKQPYGHAAEPWKTFNILHNLERTVGNEAAAAEARGRALQAFLAYRRAGGENHNPGGRLAAAVAQALATGQTGEVAAQLAALRERPDLPAYLKPMIPALQAILAGSRDPALAADPALDYDDAAEILLLVEGQEGGHGGSS